VQLDLPASWRDAAPHVLPVLRGPTSPAKAWEAGLDNADAQLIRRPLAPFLDVAVVLDLPRLRLFLNAGHTARWEIGDQAVLDAALSNLPPTTGLTPWPEADGVWQLTAGDGYESSRLALPRWLAAFADQVAGHPVAVAPDAHTLLVTGTDAGLPLEAVLHAGFNRFHEAGTPVSPAPYTVDGRGRLVPWHPPRDHPLVHRIDACHRFLAGHEYRRQQDVLHGWLRARDSPLYLSVFTMLRHKSGRVVTLACWPDGPTLLPQVDLVLLGEPGPDLLDRAPAYTWRDLVDSGVIGDAEPLLAPVRHAVGRHPPRGALPDRVNARTWVPR
jgi:hypothetical protein